MAVLTQTQLRTELDYDPETGIFRRRVARCNRVKVGETAGTHDSHGYIQISVFGRLYLASRLAWLWMTGDVVPLVEHRNNIHDDDRWENLRLATRVQNAMNTDCRRTNVLQAKNLIRVRDRYRVRITASGVRQHLGYFPTIDEAKAAYAQAVQLHHGEFGRV